jgi:LEA14-like dessication related protein
MKNVTSILLLLLLLTACGKVSDITLTGINDFEFKGMENNAVSFAARIGVSNPTSVGFTVSEVNLKTIVDGNFIGTLTANEKVRIRANSDSSYHMNFSLSMANLLTGASSLYSLSRKKQVKVEMQGYVKARSWFTVRKVDILESRMMDVPAIGR